MSKGQWNDPPTRKKTVQGENFGSIRLLNTHQNREKAKLTRYEQLPPSQAPPSTCPRTTLICSHPTTPHSLELGQEEVCRIRKREEAARRDLVMRVAIVFGLVVFDWGTESEGEDSIEGPHNAPPIPPIDAGPHKTEVRMGEIDSSDFPAFGFSDSSNLLLLKISDDLSANFPM